MLYESVAFFFGHPVQKYRKKVLALYDPHSNSECRGGEVHCPQQHSQKLASMRQGLAYCNNYTVSVMGNGLLNKLNVLGYILSCQNRGIEKTTMKYCKWLNFCEVPIFVVFMEGPIHELM